MKHIAYAETVVATDDHVADLVLEYAKLLARANTADTVTIPGRVGEGGTEAVSLLIGPASQITTWADAEPFGDDVSGAVDELEQRIHRLAGGIPTSAEPPFGADLDDLD